MVTYCGCTGGSSSAVRQANARVGVGVIVAVAVAVAVVVGVVVAGSVGGGVLVWVAVGDGVSEGVVVAVAVAVFVTVGVKGMVAVWAGRTVAARTAASNGVGDMEDTGGGTQSVPRIHVANRRSRRVNMALEKGKVSTCSWGKWTILCIPG